MLARFSPSVDPSRLCTVLGGAVRHQAPAHGIEYQLLSLDIEVADTTEFPKAAFQTRWTRLLLMT